MSFANLRLCAVPIACAGSRRSRRKSCTWRTALRPEQRHRAPGLPETATSLAGQSRLWELSSAVNCGDGYGSTVRARFVKRPQTPSGGEPRAFLSVDVSRSDGETWLCSARHQHHRPVSASPSRLHPAHERQRAMAPLLPCPCATRLLAGLKAVERYRRCTAMAGTVERHLLVRWRGRFVRTGALLDRYAGQPQEEAVRGCSFPLFLMKGDFAAAWGECSLRASPPFRCWCFRGLIGPSPRTLLPSPRVPRAAAERHSSALLLFEPEVLWDKESC